MRLKSKVSLLCALGICVLFTSCTQGTGGSSKTASNIQAATSKPVFDILDSQQVSYEEDYSHLVKDGRFLKGKLPSSKDKKNNQARPKY